MCPPPVFAPRGRTKVAKKWGLPGRGSNLLKSGRPLTSTTPPVKAVLPTLADLPDAFYRAAIGAERVHDAGLLRGITYVSVCVYGRRKEGIGRY